MTDVSYHQEAWALDDLFAGFDTPDRQQALQQIEALTTEFESRRPRLTSDLSPQEFVSIVQIYEQLVRLVSRTSYFSYLSFAGDTQDSRFQTELAQVQQLAAEVTNRTLFFELWWKALDDEPATAFLGASGDYRYWLEALRLAHPYTLSEAEERVVNLKNVNGSQALLTLFRAMTNRYTFHLTVEGEEKELNYEELTVYYRHGDPNLRAAAYQELFRVYKKDAAILGQIYQYRVRDWHSENVRLRKFASPISVRNLDNDIPDEVVSLLLDVCRANAGLFQRYFRLKAKWLGMKKLRRCDIYAPVSRAETRYAFGDAVSLVLGSFRRFEPRIAELAERVFAEHHIDSEVRKGKQGGAFCATASPDLTPWVLQSFNGRPDDVATMAHELGHAVHALLASHHTALTHYASLPLAETASTFGEILVVERLLAEMPDPETRRDLLFRQMDGNYATIIRQAYFALFEREAHDLIQRGGSVEDLDKLYGQNLAEQFGEAIELSDDFFHEWVIIPHIYSTPFYVYAYAFGQLLVLSLYQQYLAEGDSFKPRYLRLLAAGGSDSPAALLDKAGINIQARDFWQGGFDVLKNSLEQLEAIKVETLKAS